MWYDRGCCKVHTHSPVSKVLADRVDLKAIVCAKNFEETTTLEKTELFHIVIRPPEAPPEGTKAN